MQPRVAAALRVSFGVSLAAAVLSALIGAPIAWALARYRFPARRLFDAAIDLPFALPTAVAGIALSTLYAPNGWFGAPARGAGRQGRLHAGSASSSRWSSSASRSSCGRCSR